MDIREYKDIKDNGSKDNNDLLLSSQSLIETQRYSYWYVLFIGIILNILLLGIPFILYYGELGPQQFYLSLVSYIICYVFCYYFFLLILNKDKETYITGGGEHQANNISMFYDFNAARYITYFLIMPVILAIYCRWRFVLRG